MKNMIIVHGWEGHPDNCWFPWLKKELEEKGFNVSVPEMPEPDDPKISPWVGKLKETVSDVDGSTYFVGHSVGCQTIMRFMETLPENSKVGGAFFVAPWMHLDQKALEEEGDEVVEGARPWMETPIDFEKIKKMCDKFVCIFSDNDPYVPLSEIRLFKENLGAETILENNKGHFGDDTGVKELPVLLDKILEAVK